MGWDPPSEKLSLPNDAVHVWRATLDQSASCRERFWQTLAEDERARADRFHFPRDREHFVVARGVLRAILARYLNTEPGRLSFCYSAYGKPALLKEASGDALRFNLSHSHGLALYAVTRDRELGIDVEHLRPHLADRQIAERFFSPGEVAVLLALPQYQQREAFFHCWTRKEAYIKARGEGLSLPLDQFEVSLAPGEPAALLSTHANPSEASRWSMLELTPGPGYVGALAVEGHGWRLACWQWPG